MLRAAEEQPEEASHYKSGMTIRVYMLASNY